jgi:membrane-associated phospholipid phosphatase
VAAAVCWVLAVALAIEVRRVRRPFAIDKLAFRAVTKRPLGIPVVPGGFATKFVQLGNTRDFVIVLIALVAVSLCSRDRFAACVAVAPPIALVITETVAKPLVGRYGGHVYSFPSGHATAICALAMQAAVLGYRRWGRRSLLPLGFGLAAVTVVSSAAIVRAQIHVLSDTVAGDLIGFGTVLGVAALLSEMLVRVRTRNLRSLPG